MRTTKTSTDAISPPSQASPRARLFEVRQRLVDRRGRLRLDDAIIVLRAAIVAGLEVFKPRDGLVAGKSIQVRIRELGNPSFFIRHASTVERASLPDAKMLVVARGEAVVESAVHAGERCAAWRVVVHADHVDVLGTGPPGLDVLDGVVIRAPEHEDFGVVGYGSVDGLPGGDEFVCGYDALD